LTTASAAKKRKHLFSLKIFFLEARPHYLFLPVVLILVGTGAAWYFTGKFNLSYALLALAGLILCHASVNVLNDYFDFKSGVDLKTIKSPFNGGSGILPAGLLKPAQVWRYGLVSFGLAVPIGVYFAIVQGWQLLPLLLLGAICILFYTSIILKLPFPEWSPGVGLGILPVLGAYFVQTAGYSVSAFVASVPSGILVLNLLLLNEFPDVEADKIGSKKTLPISLGKKKAAIIYSSFTALVYAWVIGAVIAGQMPTFCLIALLTLPFAIKAVRGSFGDDGRTMVPAMANNVLTVLITQALLGIGFILAGII
jgi:1,4-dihydroxy-2-naphthoate octaprenyltransferase